MDSLLHGVSYADIGVVSTGRVHHFLRVSPVKCINNVSVEFLLNSVFFHDSILVAVVSSSKDNSKERIDIGLAICVSHAKVVGEGTSSYSIEVC